MNKTYNISYNTWIDFRDKAIEIWEDHGRDGGVVVGRDLWDVLHQKDNDRKFYSAFIDYLNEHNITGKQRDEIMSILNEYDFIKNLHINDEVEYTPVLELYDVKTRGTDNRFSIDCSFKTYEEAFKYLATCHNYRTPRPGKKPYAIGSGNIYKRSIYNIDNKIVEYESLLFKSTHERVPEYIYDDEKIPCRVYNKADWDEVNNY